MYASKEFVNISQILGGEFPCTLGQANLEIQHGQLVAFSNFTNGRFNQFDFPKLNFFRYIRQT